MPLYTYQCDRCGVSCEQIAKYAERDAPEIPTHGGCGGRWLRGAVELFTQGAPAYQMQAVLSNGQKVKGHFGKSAVLRKR